MRAVLRIAVVKAIRPFTRVPADVDRRLLPLHLVKSLLLVVVIVGFEVAELVMDSTSVIVVVPEVVAAASLLVARLVLRVCVVSSR